MSFDWSFLFRSAAIQLSLLLLLGLDWWTPAPGGALLIGFSIATAHAIGWPPAEYRRQQKLTP